MKDIFFELIRVSIGTQETLTQLPSEAEWEELFEMAVKQSLVGVCFCGIHRLGADSDEGYINIGMSEDLYFDWMGMAAQINMKNELVNQQCVELQKRLAAEGFRSSILKGQGVAALYRLYENDNENENCRQDSSINPKPSTINLSGFRQSGDIDLYVDCGRKNALRYLRSQGMNDVEWDYVHTHPKFYDDTEVELHYRVSVTRNLLMNHRLQKFFDENKEEFFRGVAELPEGNIVVPSNWMNLFYLMQHAYRHLFTEGIGLRQVMDIYFALKSLKLSEEDGERLKEATQKFGLDRFASGMMWVMQSIFRLDNAVMPWVSNQREGEFLLSEIMQSGNFGKLDSRFGKASGSKTGKLSAVLRRALHLASRYTGEALCAPFYYVWHFLWKRIVSLTD